MHLDSGDFSCFCHLLPSAKNVWRRHGQGRSTRWRPRQASPVRPSTFAWLAFFGPVDQGQVLLPVSFFRMLRDLVLSSLPAVHSWWCHNPPCFAELLLWTLVVFWRGVFCAAIITGFFLSTRCAKWKCDFCCLLWTPRIRTRPCRGCTKSGPESSAGLPCMSEPSRKKSASQLWSLWSWPFDVLILLSICFIVRFLLPEGSGPRKSGLSGLLNRGRRPVAYNTQERRSPCNLRPTPSGAPTACDYHANCTARGF